MLSPLGGAAEKPFPLPALKKTIPDVMSNVPELKLNLCTQVSKAATVEKAEQAEQTPWSLASEE